MKEKLSVILAAGIPCLALAAEFSHALSGTKPWTKESFLDDPHEFHFAVIGDRTGDERPGFFDHAMSCLNLLRPEFTICVGDLVNGGGVPRPVLSKQWQEARSFLERLDMPFFYVVGNHDIWTGINGMSEGRRTSIDLWKENFGTNTYYSFTYKKCLFLALNVMEECDYYPPREPIPQHQLDWAVGEFEKHKDVTWRFIFMHKPLDWTSDRWLEFEKRIGKYDYTVFAGDWHNYCTATRNGKKYYMLGTTGGGWSCDNGKVHEDLRRGAMHGITWVTVTKDKGPVVTHLALSGIHPGTIQTCATTQGYYETPLDYPTHLTENPAKYRDERNTALSPAEVMHGPGYDWHFKLAVILRQGKVYKWFIPEWGKDDKPRVVLLGDESASALMDEYKAKGGDVLDFGFKGDRIENVLWRVIQGTLDGYCANKVVISVGRHNKGVNTDAEIAAGIGKLVSLVRERAPEAEVVVR